MLDPSTPDPEFYSSIKALNRLDRDTNGFVRKTYITKVNRKRSETKIKPRKSQYF